MTPTERYVEALTSLKPGDLGLLRTHGGQGLDESVDGFDLFTGLWWPLRAENQAAPRREVAWLIAKLYAFCPVPHAADHYLARQLGRSQPASEPERERHRKRFDRLLGLPLGQIEPALHWALNVVASTSPKLDWVKLTDDLSYWERESTRLKWAKQFLQINERNEPC